MPRSVAAMPEALPRWLAKWSTCTERTGMAASDMYISVEYVFSAYSSNADKLAKGRLSMYCSRVLINRKSQNFSELTLLPSDLDLRSVTAWWSMIEIGSRGGLPAKTLVTVSRQNCIRNWPIVGLETVSGNRASSRFRVRRAS